MPVLRLAQVELQIVMQRCDLQSLLALARCSRSTLAAASHPFAWRHCPSVSLPFVFTRDSSSSSSASAGSKEGVLKRLWRRLHSQPPPPPPLAARVSASLLRFCDIDVLWQFDKTSEQHRRQPPAITEAELDALAAVPRLRALESRWRPGLSSQLLQSLLRRPGLSGLTALGCTEEQLGDGAIGALVDCCPRLSKLSIQEMTMTWPGRSEPQLQLLPALTDLFIEAFPRRDHHLSAVALCASLRRLTLRGVIPRVVHSVLLSPGLRPTLEHLALTGFDLRYADGHWQPAATMDWSAAFINLTRLRSLELEDSNAVDDLLPVLGAHCAQLRSLRIRVQWLWDSGSVEFPLPSIAALAALLDQLPSLHSLGLCIPSFDKCALWHPMPDEQDAVATWRRVHGEMSAFAALHPQRVTLRLE